jgi:Secretion system C-terminal sorting domain
MKRFFILISICLFCSTTYSQITITRAGYTLSGVISDTFIFRDIEIANLSIPQRGGNRIWDYTGIIDSISTTKIANTPTTPSALPPTFKDATFVPTRLKPPFGVYSIIDSLFRRVDSTGLYNLGLSRGSGAFLVTAQTGGASDSLWFLPRTTRFPIPACLVKIPMTSTTASKIMTIDTVPYKLKWASAGYATPANVTHIRRVEYATEVVGWGTLRLRNPVAGRANLEFGVLFERFSELRQDSFFLNGALMPKRVLDSFRLEQGKRDTATIQYNLRGIGFRRGIISFVMSPNESFIITANRVIEPTKGLQTNNSDLVSNDVPISVFPNPTTEGVNLEFDKKTNGTWQVMVYNETGQIIDLQTINAIEGKTTHRILLDKSLPSGTYFVQLLDEMSLVRSRGKFLKL